MKPSERPTVLLLTSAAHSKDFRAALDPLKVDILCAHHLREARHFLRHHPGIGVVVTDVTLPDGNWSDVLRCFVDAGSDAALVVYSPIADEYLWSEVLWRGGHDVLVPPLRAEEVQQVVEGAHRNSCTGKAKVVRREDSATPQGLLFLTAVH